ncbi:SDR family NAD(P)-dependent oxidoreductase [Auraticoccus monumenti]|uniref:Short-chain dehydrogenase n=1 Tax=Auraticoccus monumenti TaxID=675864 RepID=A0A1G6T9U4_9ACTN|nr:SDR family NAD(P)-dependent oxidoreductase [Auraticoccus monumenti]SDD25793.1 Short-chain dehydrogenase [Auraticoccus monumenti]
MELHGARILVAGATGALGGQLTTALLAAGATVVPAGRDPERLVEVGEECGQTGLHLDVVDADACRQVVDAATETLGGLDALVVAVGVASFGRALEADDAVVEELFAVDVLGPMSLVRAAAPHLGEGGTVVVLSAILADVPTAGMAEYSAAKSALSTWLGLVGKEERRKLHVVDVRPPHLDTDLSDHPLAGTAPKLPAPYPAARVVEVVLEAVRDGKKEVVWDADAREVVAR